jgi:cation-transporting ATPase E
VLRFSVPAGVIAAAATFAGYALARAQPGVGLGEERTVATVVLFLVGMWVLGILARPYTPFRRLLVGGMAAGFGIVLAIPALRHFFALDLPSLRTILVGLGTAGLACLLLELGWRASGWAIERRPEVEGRRSDIGRSSG